MKIIQKCDVHLLQVNGYLKKDWDEMWMISSAVSVIFSSFLPYFLIFFLLPSFPLPPFLSLWEKETDLKQIWQIVNLVEFHMIVTSFSIFLMALKCFKYESKMHIVWWENVLFNMNTEQMDNFLKEHVIFQNKDSKK